jgi:pSer/pThr/pTyr-binding forkhead associated (FHA) protein
LRIGRLLENEIRLDDLIVSGRHAQIEVKPSRYLEGSSEVHIEDLGSTNGTLVDGKPIKHHLLKHGEVVRIGTDELTFIDEEVNASDQTVIYLPEDD